MALPGHADRLVLILPRIGDSDVLAEVQEPELEMQFYKVYIPVGFVAYADSRLSCSRGNNNLVSDILNRYFCKEFEKAPLLIP